MFENVNYILKYKLYKFKIKKRFNFYKRRRGKHLDNMFLCRRKRYDLYYQIFDSKLTQKNIGAHKKTLQESCKKYKYRTGLKSTEFDLIRSTSLKSIKYCSQRFLKSRKIHKRVIKNKLSIFPSYWLTAKPKSVRMGKGKGERKIKVCFLSKGKDIYNIKFLYKYFNYKIKKKIYIFKISIFINFLLQILKVKTTTKNVVYKKIY